MILFLLTIILSDIALLLIILISGIIIACVASNFSLYELVSLIEHTEFSLIYLISLGYGIILSRKKLIMERKREGMMTLAHRIKHELNTPLMTIKLACSGLAQYLPRLIRHYQNTQEQATNATYIPTSKLKQLPATADYISKECSAIGNIMNLMLTNAKEIQQNKRKYVMASMYHCIEQAIARYPFPQTFDSKTQIHWHKTADFHFLGTELLMIHVLLNLFKNAVYAILDAQKGHIEISNSEDERHNYLHFRDTGMGIKAHHLNYLFDNFFTSHESGTGLGLPFCKSTLEHFSGKIHCESSYGEYTTFILKLPKQSKPR